MPIEPIMRDLYLFIKSYGETHRVKIENLRLWADQKGIKRQEMGYALKLLQDNKLVVWKGPKLGFVAMPLR